MIIYDDNDAIVNVVDKIMVMMLLLMIMMMMML